MGISQIAEKYGVSESKVGEIRSILLSDNKNIIEEQGIEPELRRDILTLDDLMEGMKVRGTVRNISDFGAFVDIGIHMDGLVHKSKISHKYVKNPREFLQVGQNIEVTVIGIDKHRERLSLSMVD